MSDYQNALPPPVTINDFTGGITDNFIGAQSNQYETGDNFLVLDNKKGITRSGTLTFATGLERIPAGNVRVADLFTHDDVFFQAAATQVWQTGSGSFSEMLGPVDSNLAFSVGAASNFTSHDEWNKHRMITSDAFGSPKKIYKDNSSVMQIRNAGLPKATLTGSITQANAIKVIFNAHVADVAEHLLSDTANIVSTANAFDLPSLLTLVADMLTKYASHDSDVDDVTPTFHQATSTLNSLVDAAAPLTLSDAIVDLDDLKAKYNLHDADSTSHTTGATHAVSTFIDPQFSGSAGTLTYIYTFVAFFEYMIGNETFQDFGPTHQVTVASILEPSAGTVSITNIPVISNGTTECWDTATIKWYIYRTEQNGTTHLFLDSVTNGTTTFSDSADDDAITDNAQIYTAGGVLDNDQPPQAKYLTVINDICWYAHVKQGTSIHPSRVLQSTKFDPDSVPEGNFIDLEDTIIGIAGIDQYPIIFCENSVFRLEGFSDDQGRGTLQKREISTVIGCLSHRSIVETRDGIVWAGTDGFYWTDGFKLLKISDELDTRNAGLTETANQKARIHGAYDKSLNRVHWAISSDSGVSDNDTIYVLDLKWGIKPDSCFTTETATDSWEPTALGFDETGTFAIGDRNGYLFKFDDNAFTDPTKDTTEADESLWLESAIIFDYKGPSINFGDESIQKWVTWITLLLENKTSISLQIKSENENSGNAKNLAEIRFRDQLLWLGDDAAPWLDPAVLLPWLTFPILKVKRRFPNRNARCTYKQVQFTNSNTIIQNSDDFGTVTIDSSAKSAVLNTAGSTWLTDVTDFTLSVDDDSFTEDLVITSRDSSTQITYSDPTGIATTDATKKWILRGTRKKERFNIISYSLIWAPLTPSYQPFRGITGANA